MPPFPRSLIRAVYGGFVLTGVVTTLLGPVLPALVAGWSLDDRQAGSLFTAQFAGSMAGVALSSRLMERLGYTAALVCGYALMAAGVAGVGLSGWPAGVAAVFLFGAGQGTAIPTTNLLIAVANPARRAAALNLVNFAWTVGAVASPPIIGPLARRQLAAPMLGLALLLGLAAAWLLRYRRHGRAALAGDGEDAESTLSLLRRAAVIGVALLAYFYTGAENVVGGWIAAYALRMDESMRALWAFLPSSFYAALLVGRAGAPLILRRWPAERLTMTGLLVAAAGIVALLLAEGIAVLMLGTALAGLGLAPVFPNLMAMVAERWGRMAGRVSAILFTASALGGATIPVGVGYVSYAFDSLRAGLSVALACALMMIALSAPLRRAGVRS